MARSIYASAATSQNVISVRLFKQGLHNTPKKLRTILQEEINALDAEQYDAILLVYGMCGTSTVGLTARRTPIVIPRAHDCISLYLGSGQRYQEEFDRHPGTYWYSVDYIERNDEGANVALGAADMLIQESQYQEYVRKFGKETADMLMETMSQWSQHYSRAVFIDTGLGNCKPYEEMAREKAKNEGWVFERKTGNQRLVEMLIEGQWSEEEFLFVPPGFTIKQSYDEDLINAHKEM
jgi:hypothetical protein